MVWERLEKNNIKTILLVEDEAIIAMDEKMTLEKFGYRVVTAGTGDQALDIVEKNQHIDLVLMDINLGEGISGTEAAAQILESHDIPLIFLSGHTERDVVEKTEGITSYGYIVKNSGEEVMHASIKMAFKLFEAKKKAQEKEKQLQRNEQKYRTLFKNMAQGVFYQRADGKIIDSNPAALKMFGLDRKNFIGRTSADSRWKVIREDGTLIPSEEHPSKLALRTGKPVRNKIIAVYNPHIKDYVWMEVNAIPQFKAGQNKPFQVFVTMHDITPLKRMEDLLQFERDRAQSYLDLAGTMILVLDKEGKISRINPKGCEILGCEEQDLVGKDWFDNFIPEENREEIKSIFKKILEGKDSCPYEYVDEHKILTTTGIERLILWHNAVLRDKDGKITGTLSSGEDVTKWVEAQKVIRESEEKYRALYENAPLPYQSLDKDGCFLDVNPAWLNTLGYTREEIIGSHFSDFLHPDCISRFERSFPELKRSGYVHDVQHKIRHKNGNYLDVSYVGHAGYDQDGSFRQTYCVFHDITQRKRAEEALRKSEERYRNIYNKTPVMLHSIDRDGRLLNVSDFWLKTLGYERNEVIGRKSVDFLTEESRRYAQEVSLPEFYKTGIAWNIPYQFVKKNGEVIDILISAICERDESGNIERSLAVLNDVTDQKRAEEAYRALVEYSLQGLCIIQDGRIVFANKALTNMFGYTMEELTDMTPEQISHSFLDEGWDFIQQQADAKDKKQPMKEHYEIQVYNKNKNLRWTEQFVRSIVYRGKPAIQIAVIDITERKLFEERIRTLLKEKELLLKEVHHRIKNNFAFIESSISLQRRSLDSSKAKEALQDAVRRVSSMRILYDKLLAADDYSETQAEEYLTDLADTLFSSFPRQINIKLEKQLDNIKFPSKIIFPLGIIVTELLTNIIKYAFPDKKDGLVKIDLKKRKNKVQLKISDNGIGLPAGFKADQPEGFGLVLVELLSKQLGGRFRIEGQSGTKAVLEFYYESNNP
jgi:PAS domain S-box-containing protein